MDVKKHLALIEVIEELVNIPQKDPFQQKCYDFLCELLQMKANEDWKRQRRFESVNEELDTAMITEMLEKGYHETVDKMGLCNCCITASLFRYIKMKDDETKSELVK